MAMSQSTLQQKPLKSCIKKPRGLIGKGSSANDSSNNRTIDDEQNND